MSDTIILFATVAILACAGAWLLLKHRPGGGGAWMPPEARAQLQKEHRRKPRVPLVTEVEISAFQRSVRGVSVNVAVGGMLLKPSAPLDVGEPVSLSFVLPNSVPVTMPGAVCRKQGAEVAVKFDPLANQRELIEDWVEQQVKSG